MTNLPAIFSIPLVAMETTRHLLVIGQLSKSAWRRALFSQKSLTFLKLKRNWAAEKDAGGGVLKRAQDFSENTVYSIGL